MLEDYYAELWKQVRKNLKSYLVTKEQPFLHKLRVDIKKLRALSEFIEHCDKDYDSHKSLKLIREIFHTAGHLRDAFVLGKLAEEFKVNKELFVSGNDKQRFHFEKLKKLFLKKSYIIADERRKAAKKNSYIKTELLIEYIAGMRNEIIAQLKNSSPKKLHSTRREIKKLLVLHKLYSKAEKKILPQADILFFDNIQESMGNLHDLENFRNALMELRMNSVLRKKVVVVSNQEKLLSEQIFTTCNNWLKLNTLTS